MRIGSAGSEPSRAGLRAQQRAEALLQEIDGAREAEILAKPVVGRGAESRAAARIARQEIDRVRQRLPFARGDELALAARADELGDAGERGRDDREPLACGLEQDVRQAVAIARGRGFRRQHEEIGVAQEIDHLRLRPAAEERDLAADPGGLRGALQPLQELAAPGEWEALSNAINLLARDPRRRAALGGAAYDRLRQDFGFSGAIDLLEGRFRALLGPPPDAAAVVKELA